MSLESKIKIFFIVLLFTNNTYDTNKLKKHDIISYKIKIHGKEDDPNTYPILKYLELDNTHKNKCSEEDYNNIKIKKDNDNEYKENEEFKKTPQRNYIPELNDDNSFDDEEVPV